MVYECDFPDLSVQFFTDQKRVYFDSRYGFKDSITCLLTFKDVQRLAGFFREIEIYLEKNSEDIG